LFSLPARLWLKRFHGGNRPINTPALFPQLGQDFPHIHAWLLTGEPAISITPAKLLCK
jgi:hypothetical protein